MGKPSIMQARQSLTRPSGRCQPPGGSEEFVVGEVLTAHNFDVVDDGLYFSSLTETDGSSIRFFRFATQRTEWIRRIDAPWPEHFTRPQLAAVFDLGLYCISVDNFR